MRPDGAPKRTPPPPTPIRFPQYTEAYPSSSAWNEGIALEDLPFIFSIKRIETIEYNPLQMLNLHVDNAVPVSKLVPTKYIPTGSSEDDVPSTQTLSNGGPIPNFEAHYRHSAELMYESEEVYNFLAKVAPSPLGGEKKVDLKHFRNFWQQLQEVGLFWDSSKDNLSYEEMEAANRKSAGSSLPALNLLSNDAEPNPKYTYTGRRVNSGAAMDTNTLMKLLEAFVQPLVYAFHCFHHSRTDLRHLHIGKWDVSFGLREFRMVYRKPRNQNDAKNGILEGPVIGFKTSSMRCSLRDKKEGVIDESVDGTTVKDRLNDRMNILADLAALLLLAQERYRGGQRGPFLVLAENYRPYATANETETIGEPLVPDGFESMAAFEAWQQHQEERKQPRQEGASNATSSETSRSPEKKRKMNFEAGVSRVPKRQLSQSLNYRAPPKRWDPKVRYGRIGAPPPNQHRDEVYLVSATNHHVSIVKLTVDDNVLDFLERGGPIEPEAWGFKLERSPWFDLFKMSDRRQAMDAVWGVLHYMMR